MVWDIAGGEVHAELTDVDLVLLCNLNLKSCKCDRSCSDHVRIDTGDTRNEEVRLGEIKQLAVNDGGDGSGSIDLCKLFLFSTSTLGQIEI